MKVSIFNRNGYKNQLFDISEIDLAIYLIRIAPFENPKSLQGQSFKAEACYILLSFLNSKKGLITEGKQMAVSYRSKIDKGTMAHIFIGLIFTFFFV